jgi:hypothetical protein
MVFSIYNTGVKIKEEFRTQGLALQSSYPSGGSGLIALGFKHAVRPIRFADIRPLALVKLKN